MAQKTKDRRVSKTIKKMHVKKQKGEIKRQKKKAKGKLQPIRKNKTNIPNSCKEFYGETDK